MTNPAFWIFLAIAVLSWAAVLGRWVLAKTSVSERLAVRRWLRQSHWRHR